MPLLPRCTNKAQPVLSAWLLAPGLLPVMLKCVVVTQQHCCSNTLHAWGGGGTTQVLPTVKTHGSTSASFGLNMFIEEKDWMWIRM